MSHIVISLAIQLCAALLTSDWWLGAACGAWYFIGREYAQAEYRVIVAHYGGKRANAPWWCGLQPRAWTEKGIKDWMLPAAAVFAVAFLTRQFVLS